MSYKISVVQHSEDDYHKNLPEIHKHPQTILTSLDSEQCKHINYSIFITTTVILINYNQIPFVYQNLLAKIQLCISCYVRNCRFFSFHCSTLINKKIQCITGWQHTVASPLCLAVLSIITQHGTPTHLKKQ